MDNPVLADFARAFQLLDGYLLASTVAPEAPASDPARLYTFHRSLNAHSASSDLRYILDYNLGNTLEDREVTAWADVFAAYHGFVGKLLAAEEAHNIGRFKDANWIAVYDAWKDVCSALLKGYNNTAMGAWTIPCLYTAAKYVRIFAIKADEKTASQRDSGGIAFGGVQDDDAFDSGSKNEKLEDAARVINRIFAICLGDRSPIEDSRKWALYYTANLLFKTYFKLNTLNLCKNVLRPLQAPNTDMPPLESFPKSHQVTFKFYNGVLRFLQEDYSAAEQFLESAYSMCLTSDAAKGNLEGILMYLIPTKLVTSHLLPTMDLLRPYPNLMRLFVPIRTAILRADLSLFNAALEEGGDEFVKRRIYLTLERGRDVILRNIFRKVFLAGGLEPPKEGEGRPALRRTRVPVKEFAAALQMAGAEVGDGEGGVDGDEVECLIANAIYKNFVKGYIARDRGIVVLSKNGAFPGTGV